MKSAVDELEPCTIPRREESPVEDCDAVNKDVVTTVVGIRIRDRLVGSGLLGCRGVGAIAAPAPTTHL